LKGLNTLATYISPHFTEEKLDNPSINDLIDVFEDRTRYWMFEPIKILLNEPQNHFAALCILLTYFEGIWIYIQGKSSEGKSKQFFREAFVNIMKNPRMKEELYQHAADVLYEDARCGFFHDGMLRGRIFLTKADFGEILITIRKKNGVIDEKGEIPSILVDVEKCYKAIERHFTKFIGSLRDTSQTDLRLRFEKICKEKWNWEKATIIGLSDPLKILNNQQRRIGDVWLGGR
jgi:hypothetical protein